jgi:hypothetical protein
MNRKMCLFLVSGAACSVTALAQVAVPGPKLVPGPDGEGVVTTPVRGFVELPFGGTEGESYGERAPGFVLDNLGGSSAFFASTSKAFIFNNSHMDEFTFNPGPWATAAVREIDQFQFAWFTQSYTGPSPAFDHIVNFYDNLTPNYTGADILDPDGAGPLPRATPTRSIRVPHPTGAFPDPTGGAWTAVSIVNLGGTDQPARINLTSDKFVVEIKAVAPGTDQLCFYDSAAFAGASLFQAANATPNTLFVGHWLESRPISPGNFISEDHARDMNGDGTFAGQAAVIVGGGFDATTVLRDRRVSRVNATRPRSAAISIRGDIVVPPPFVTLDLTTGGCLADGDRTVTTPSRAPGAFQIIKFCLSGDATDDQRRFLDIVGDPGDADNMVALYNNSGALASLEAADDNSGDGSTVPALSFGIGRRAKPFTGGVPLDGRNGELLAGTFFLVVGGPGSGFGDGFNFAPGDVSLDGGGSSTVKLTTNTNAGALAPSIPPDPADYGGDTRTVPPSSTGADQQPDALRPMWNKFTLCEDLNTPGEFLDIDMGRTTNPDDTDTGIFLFDKDGNLVATNDDAGATIFTSQLSFGEASTPARTPSVAGADSLNNQDGTLPAGDYYIATALLTFSTSGDRWHVRAESGSSIPQKLDILTNVDCLAGCPCAADYDGSGGTPDAGDIDAFFSDWLLGEAKADADCSGGTPDAGDIDTFFAQWLAGGC